METFLIAIATMGGLGFIFAGALALADKKLSVEENPLISRVNEVLPGANCGGCGFAGCYDFATNVVEGKAKVTGCPVGGSECASSVATIMGVDSDGLERMIPRILCLGGYTEAAQKMAGYNGPLSCSAMDLVSGGDKMCFYGCLGGGDCVAACPFNAMIMTSNALPEVIEDLCTGCGMCAKACPRDIIEMHPISREVFVFCKSQDDPKTSKAICAAACIGCSICARKSDGGVVMNNNLAVINYELLEPEKIPFDKCPTNSIRKISIPVN
ncbi:MAG: RnfABCDGE type electron transport complex subunit B [Ignavibacteriaceae bacterium]|nr:RnfABCDGE type electron transport complex subunit B [Ignavibacteriaceae bacterium]